MLKYITLTLLASTLALAQPARPITIVPVNIDQGPYNFRTTLPFYDANGNNIYNCYAVANQTQTFIYSVANGNLTNIVVSGGTGTATTAINHGLQTGNPILISNSATAGLNGTYIITVTGATTFTFTTGAGSATYTDGVISTHAPPSSFPVWYVVKQTFNASNLATLIQVSSGVYASGSPGVICDNRTTLAYQ